MTQQSYAHQVEAGALMTGKPAFMLACDAGTGKSRMILDDMARIARLNTSRGKPAPAFWLLAPSGVHSESWPHEIAAWWPRDVPLRVHVYTSGQGKRLSDDRYALAHATPLGTATIFVQHYESLSALSGQVAATAYLHASAARGRLIGAYLDEIHWCKTPKAARTKTITKLVHKYARLRRGASGTLVGKGHEDVYAPYKILDPNIVPKTFTAFKAEYCVEKSMGGRFTKIVSYRNVAGLYASLAPITMRVTRDECLTLPDRQIIDRRVPLTPEQRRLQDDLRTLTIAELQGGTITATEAGTRLVRFAQIANGFVALDDDGEGVLTDVPTLKTAALTDILTTYTDDKVIVFGRFHGDIDRTVRACKEADTSVVRHDGRMSKDDRDAALSKWRTPDGPRVLVATMPTLGIGRTLNEATLMIFYTTGYDRIIYEQSAARNYRAGQTRKCVLIRLIVSRSIDESMLASLSRKEGMQAPLDALGHLMTDLHTNPSHSTERT